MVTQGPAVAGRKSPETATRGWERWEEPAWRQSLRSLARGIDSTSVGIGRLARGWRSLAPAPRGCGPGLRLEHVACDLCGAIDAEPFAVGEDFEYWTSPDTFLMVRCRRCELLYLDPRPGVDDLGTIYPDDYHAYAFDEERFGLVHRVRERLEANRLRRWAVAVPDGGRVLDVGCGDGFHLEVLRRALGRPVVVEGVDPDPRAAAACVARGLTVHQSRLADAGLESGRYDLVLMVQTIEHVDEPVAVLREVCRVLKPGGRLVVITDNAGSPDARIFGSRHWGGYHFPRHFHLYTASTLAATAQAAGLDVQEVVTAMSPVNWVYSLRNLLVDHGAGSWVTRLLALDAPIGLAAGTILDTFFWRSGRGALLQGTFVRPGEEA